MKYKNKPVVIEAVKWNGDKISEVTDWISKALDKGVIMRFGNEVKIHTLEGIMTASSGDYIIKGINGEIYPCKPDIFDKTYDIVKEDTDSICFGDAIEVLKQGGAIRRKGWNGKGLFVIKQVPAHIESGIIPKMQSLPQSAKDLILKERASLTTQVSVLSTMRIPAELIRGLHLSVMFLQKIGRSYNDSDHRHSEHTLP